ncbi:MAG: amidohydrolase family protein [Bacteroidia bacterium]|nr:amidohydrolase family protein [Bacteroidia bacterium]
MKEIEQRANIHKNLQVIGFKIFADGVLEFPTQTAAISYPYVNSGKQGSLLVTPALLNRFVLFADRNHQLVHIHAIGDRAVSVSLEAFAMARRQSRNSVMPHSITHLQIVKPGDFGKFQRLHVLPVMQLLWATADRYTVELVKPYLHPDLYQYHYPANALANAGAIICGASDWPVSSANPFEAMAIAETRKGDLGVLTPAQRVDRTTMLKAYTTNAATAILMEEAVGSIEPGKQADLIMVDRDVMRVDADSLAERG